MMPHPSPPPDDPAATARALAMLTVAELRHRYAEVFGEPTRSNHKQHLIKRIAWRLQADAEGGLTARARRRAAVMLSRLVSTAQPRQPPPPSTIPHAPHHPCSDSSRTSGLAGRARR